MAKAETYIKCIRSQLKGADGKVPNHLDLTIRNYAKTLEMRDFYMDTILKEGASRYTKGSTGQDIVKQHPVCNLYYQQESLCQTYAKMLGLTAAKAAMKVEPTDDGVTNPMKEFFTNTR